MKKTALIILLALITQTITAQTKSCFDEVLEAAKTDYYNKDYFLALQKLNAIENACVNLETISKAQRIVVQQWRDSIAFAIEKMVLELQVEKKKSDSLLLVANILHKKMETAVFEKAISGRISKDEESKWLYEDLDSLDLKDNALTRLPDEVKYCYNLEYINLIGNDIENWDSCFSILSNLNLKDVYIEVDSVNQILNKYYDLITGLKIKQSGLKKIPQDVWFLNNLDYLDMSGTSENQNDLEILPQWISNLKNVKYLKLQYCKLKEIDPKIGTLNNLKLLDLSNNLIKELPATIINLCNLEEFYISNNKIKEIDYLPYSLYLKKIDLSFNKIDELPDYFFGDTITNRNKFAIKVELSPSQYNYVKISGNSEDFSNIEYLNLSNNSFKSLPSIICSFSNLEYLDISYNEISRMPNEFIAISNLKHLDLRSNKFTLYPTEINNNTMLEYLDFSSMNFTYFPEEILNNYNLKYLKFTGSSIKYLPETIGNLQKLIELHLDYNLLDSLPSEIGDCKKLKVLRLNNNNLTKLPEKIYTLSNLKELYLFENEIKSYSSSISNLTKLVRLNLTVNSDNCVNTIVSLSKIKSLTNLYLQFDTDLKELPKEISKLTNLSRLDLAGNKLSSLPVDIKELKKLEKLNLMDNDFSKTDKQMINDWLPNCTID